MKKQYEFIAYEPDGWYEWTKTFAPEKDKECLFMEIIADERKGEVVSTSYYVGQNTDTEYFIFSDGSKIHKKDFFNAGDFKKVILFNPHALPETCDISEFWVVKD